MRSAPVLALALALGACGDDGFDAGSCKPTGLADVAGTVKEMPVGPFVRAELVPTDDAAGSQFALALDEVDGACGEVGTTGKHLVLLFCAAPAPGMYAIGSEQTYHCPTAGVLAILEEMGGGDFATATSGQVMIDHAGACTDGTYTATFGVDELSGTFNAVSCAATTARR